MAKSKELLLTRYNNGTRVTLRTTVGTFLISLCFWHLSHFFGIKLKPGESKRFRITIEEVNNG